MSTLRTWTRIWRIVSQSSSPGVARATAARKAAATTARSASWSRVKSALRCRLVMSVEPDPGLRHLHPRLPLQDVEQDEHVLAGGDAALEDGGQAAPWPVGDAHGGAGLQRARGDDAVELLWSRARARRARRGCARTREPAGEGYRVFVLHRHGRRLLKRARRRSRAWRGSASSTVIEEGCRPARPPRAPLR